MQYVKYNGYDVSRFGIGTKRLPTEDTSRVVRLDRDAAHRIATSALEHGITYFDTSYSNHKGEAEPFLGQFQQEHDDKRMHIATSFFEIVDPRYEYVFQKQLKKLESDHLDFYRVDGVSDINRQRDIASGAVDFFFRQKELGLIENMGFSSHMSAENLSSYLSLYPWDFVRMEVNFCDWFMCGGSERYAAACEAGVPVIAHAPLRMGASGHLKEGARALLEDAAPDRTEAEWALLFVKTLENILTVTCNLHSTRELDEDAKVFDDDRLLAPDEIALLEKAAEIQKAAPSI